MDDKKWGMFGLIPEGYEAWFCKESGTYWSPKKNEWRIRHEVVNTIKAKNGWDKKTEINIYKINRFSAKYYESKDIIKERMSVFEKSHNSWNNKDVFDLMSKGKCSIIHEGKTIEIML